MGWEMRDVRLFLLAKVVRKIGGLAPIKKVEFDKFKAYHLYYALVNRCRA